MNKNNRKDYLFWTSKDDVVIKSVQCLDCKFQIEEDIMICLKYGNKKPRKVLRCEEECPKFERSLILREPL